LKNTGGVYSCTCPAWRNQSIGIERRTCKHLRKYRGGEAEAKRIGSAVALRPEPATGETSAAPGLLLAQTWDIRFGAAKIIEAAFDLLASTAAWMWDQREIG
jgi:DNA ligase-1